MSSVAGAVARRGRPVEADPDEIARIALRLFVENGFDETSMDEIAAAASVSRRTLFRYFPSKNALVWGGATEAAERMRAALAALPPDEPAMTGLRRAYVQALTFPPELIEVTRSRLLVISRNEALQAYGLHGIAPFGNMLAEFIASRTGASPSDLRPQVVGAAASAATTAALYWWAEFGEGEPQLVVDAALAALA